MTIRIVALRTDFVPPEVQRWLSDGLDDIDAHESYLRNWTPTEPHDYFNGPWVSEPVGVTIAANTEVRITANLATGRVSFQDLETGLYTNVGLRPADTSHIPDNFFMRPAPARQRLSDVFNKWKARRNRIDNLSIEDDE